MRRGIRGAIGCCLLVAYLQCLIPAPEVEDFTRSVLQTIIFLLLLGILLRKLSA